ncbi:hypothetical protein SEA_YOSIF_69 [Streptomyces phage Yosif]|uniref:Uncharacterized protein n=1 Tax=Streptomyces phage Yosif TaxID=2201421 RepID=A0A2Z4QCK6_9CAUD|nr:hypothetical protein KGG71_gp69 [Streptomyces phage Yosif]AWY07633.1 hypothetical protein SEA_YOSIF_69 [Streptomyces phage Yosif]
MSLQVTTWDGHTFIITKREDTTTVSNLIETAFNDIAKLVEPHLNELPEGVRAILEGLVETASDDAYQDGHSDGYSEGEEWGFQDGQESGYQDGYDTGYDEGFEAGQEEAA